VTAPAASARRGDPPAQRADEDDPPAQRADEDDPPAQRAREDAEELERSLLDPDRFSVIFDRYFAEIHGYVAGAWAMTLPTTSRRKRF
jgi:hypothetical protein